MTAYLCLDSWAGRRKEPIEIIKENPKRYRVKLLGSYPLPRGRWGREGDEILVPKYAVRIEE